jgi:chromosome segregation ATPase
MSPLPDVNKLICQDADYFDSDTIQCDITKFTRMLNDLVAKVSEQCAHSNEQDDLLNDLNARVRVNTANISSMAQAIQNINQEIGSINNRLSALTNRVTSLETKVTNLETNMQWFIDRLPYTQAAMPSDYKAAYGNMIFRYSIDNGGSYPYTLVAAAEGASNVVRTRVN